MRVPVYLGYTLSKEPKVSPMLPLAFAAELSVNGPHACLSQGPQLFELPLLTGRVPGKNPQCPSSIEREHLS